MPESRSGRRTASDWNTSARVNMPAPATTHAISAPRTPVATPNWLGRVKTPPPTIEPTTIPVRVRTDTFWTALLVSVVLIVLLSSPADGAIVGSSEVVLKRLRERCVEPSEPRAGRPPDRGPSATPARGRRRRRRRPAETGNFEACSSVRAGGAVTSPRTVPYGRSGS